MPIEAISENDLVHTDFGREKKKRSIGLNDVTDIRHTAFATSASSNKIAFVFRILTGCSSKALLKGTWANNADQYQTSQCAASDQCLRYMPKQKGIHS